jgi:chloride channel 7
LPENKCYLNGSDVPGFFTKRTLRIRVATTILANAAGYPVGREGPTVVIGSNVAFLLSEWLAQPFVKQWVKFSRQDRSLPAVIVDEERFGHATRISCAVGGACGMAMIFNAPFGGLLYMFEEMTSVAWPLELSFRVFVATMLCAILSYAMLNLIGSDIREFVIYAFIPSDTTWQWQDVPLFILMSAMLGVFTSLHTRGMLACHAVRNRWTNKVPQRFQPWAKIVETLGYNVLCTLLAVLVSLWSTCTDEGLSGLQYVRFNCPEGTYNPIASLLINTSHSSVKLLFSGNNGGEIGKVDAFLSFCVYGLLNVGLAGLPVPGGAFTASMLIGGLFGRSVGSLCSELGLIDHTVTGVYAVVGSAAMLCGFKQMTLAVTLITVECVNDLELGPVVMLGVFVSMLVNWRLNEQGHDEAQIETKKLPYLDGEVKQSLDSFVARDLCDEMTREALLRSEVAPADVRRALEEKHVYAFPVLNKATCIGIITRPHLEAALRSISFRSGHKRTRSRAFQENPFEVKDDDQAIRAVQGSMPEGGDLMPLHRIMDPTPFTIIEEMPAPRLYNLFAKAGERAAVVVSRKGEFRGVISRLGLIKAAREGPRGHCSYQL